MGIKISYNTLVYANEDISEGIKRLSKFGYDGVDFVGEPDNYDAGRIKNLLVENEIEASSICAVFNMQRDFASSNQMVRKQATKYVNKCADFAEKIGAKSISIQATACMKIDAEAPIHDEWNWAVEAIRESGKYAADKNIRLTLEAWNRYETYLLNRIEQAADMVVDINLPNVGVMADTFHMNIEEVDMAEAIRKVGDLLYYVHIADSNRAAPGRGHIDFVPIAQALRDINYDGWVAMEILPPSANPFAGVVSEDFYDKYTKESVEFLRKLFKSVP